MSIKNLVGKKMTKDVKFMGDNVKISKLTVAQVVEIQEQAKRISDNEKEGFEVLKLVVRSGVQDGSELSDADFEGFPLEELSNLSNEIMKFSGIQGDQGK